MVERFQFYVNDENRLNWKINPFGNWVRYEDYEKVQRLEEAKLDLLQDWLMQQRIELFTNDKDYWVKHDLLKAVGQKIRELRESV